MYIGMKLRNMATMSSIRHKHLRIDQAKLDKAKKVLFAATETEALDRALALVVSEAAVDTALRQVGSKGKLKKVFP
jgi:hypothetical protein